AGGARYRGGKIMTRITVLRAASFCLPVLLAGVSAHAQAPSLALPEFTAVSAIADWLSLGHRPNPPAPEPPRAADIRQPRETGPSPPLPRRRPAELAPTSVPANRAAPVPIND